MRPVSDPVLVRDKMSEIFGREIDVSQKMARGGTYVLADETGFVMFSSEGPGLYSVVIGFDEGARGKVALGKVNEAISWLFVNTDALVVQATINKSNKPSLVMARNTFGFKSSSEGAHEVFCKATLAKWAKDYGIEKALSEMRAAGQSEKADKLEAAVKAAGVL